MQKVIFVKPLRGSHLSLDNVQQVINAREDSQKLDLPPGTLQSVSK